MYSGGNWSKIKTSAVRAAAATNTHVVFLCENASLKVHVRTQERKRGAELRGGSRAWSTTRVGKVVWRAQTSIQQFSPPTGGTPPVQQHTQQDHKEAL